jgi:SET domain-containing protein
MFRVPTYVSRSSIHGFGVFAAARIPRGTTIWEFDEGADWALTEADLAAFPARLREQLESWTYVNDDGLYVLCSDAAKFMNHSFQPNCDDEGPRYTIAARDIEVGEELTCDYRAFDRTSKENGLPEYQSAAS